VCSLICPNCNRDIPIQDVVYCPFCGIDLVKVKKHTGFPIAAGVLTIIASCIAFIPGIIGFIQTFSFVNNDYNYSSYFFAYFFMAIFGILSFALGLTSGILILKRKHFVLAFLGIAFNIFAAVVTSLAVPYLVGLIFGAPIFVLSIISLVFTAISRKEFS
jgi:hypothetical protein